MCIRPSHLFKTGSELRPVILTRHNGGLGSNAGAMILLQGGGVSRLHRLEVRLFRQTSAYLIQITHF